MEQIAGSQSDYYQEGASAILDDQSISLVEQLSVTLTEQEIDKSRQILRKLYSGIKNENNKVEVLELNVLLQTEKFNEFHPALFKRINDIAKANRQSGRELSEQEFIALFFIDRIDVGSNADLITVFELLDEQRTGMVSARALVNFLRFMQRVRRQDLGSSSAEVNEGSEAVLNEVIERFNITQRQGDGELLLSPEEFFNVISAFSQ